MKPIHTPVITVAIDPRVYTPPLTGIARVAETIKTALQEAGGLEIDTTQASICTMDITLPRPQRLYHFLWRNKITGPLFPLRSGDGVLGNTDIFHSLWPFGPLPYTGTGKPHVPSIATVHDIIPLHEKWGEEFSQDVITHFKNDTQDALLRADHVMFVSEYTKNETLKYFNLPFNPKRMSVVHLGVHPLFHGTDSLLGAPAPESLQLMLSTIHEQRHTLRNGFFMIAGSVLPHKNIQAVIDAYSESFPPLVIVGKQTQKIETGQKRNIFFTGYIEDADLLWLYDNATALIHPSLHEGFGLPPLEAMARNCPVIAHNGTSIPEVVGNAALLIDCTNTSALVEAIADITLSKELRDQLIQNGREHVKKFMPLAFAQRLEVMYQRVLAGKQEHSK